MKNRKARFKMIKKKLRIEKLNNYFRILNGSRFAEIHIFGIENLSFPIN